MHETAPANAALTPAPDPTRIPRVLHFIWWQGWHSIPPLLRFCVTTWQRTHPHHTVYFWDKPKLEQLLRGWPDDVVREAVTALYGGYLHDIQRIDLMRLLVLYRFGGVYADVDLLCLRPIDELLAGHSFYICREKEASLSYCNALIASRAEHPLLPKIWHFYRELQPLQHQYPHQAMGVLRTTGPRAMTQALLHHKAAAFCRLDPAADHFYAEAWTEIPRALRTPCPDLLRQTHPSAYAVHLWAGSWRRAVVASGGTPPPRDHAGREVVSSLQRNA